METKKVKETELEKELKQMNNDVLYRVMQCFIDRKAKELNVDSSDIYLRADEQDKCIDVFKMLYDGETLEFEHSEHTT